MKIALAQVNTGPSLQQNLETVTGRTEDAAGQGAEVVVFPEAALMAFDGDVSGYAAQDAGWAHQQIAELSTRSGVTVVVGSFEQARDGRTLNALLVSGPDGAQEKYYKIHLYDAFGYRESDSIAPGSQPLTLDIAGVRAGLAICYDVRFPELFRSNAADGAQVQIVSASWGDGPGKAEQWDLLTRARALDTGSWVVAVGQAVRDPRHEGEKGEHPLGVGHSAVIRPDGTDLLRMDGAPALRVVEIEPEAVEQTRAAIAVLENAKL